MAETAEYTPSPDAVAPEEPAVVVETPPTETPTPEPTPDTESRFQEGEDAISDILSDDFDEEPTPEPKPPLDDRSSTEVRATPSAPEIPVKEAPASAPKPPEIKPEPVAKPATPPAAPTATPLTTEELLKRRGELVDNISKQYHLTDEQADMLVTNPNEVLPKLAGNLFMNVYDAVYSAVLQQVPLVVNQMASSQAAATNAENTFFGRWSQLKKPEYRTAIESIGRAYRQANPKASKEEFIEQVGAMASFQLGLLPQAVASPQPVPAAPSNPQRFTPAAPGAAVGRTPQASHANEFEELAFWEEKDE